jgi:acyl-CoA reductase-like NAD-dependent aldehyde dehydrogenase
MPLRDFNPKLSDEAREAVSAAFDATAECHNEAAASREKVVAKIAQAVRARRGVATGRAAAPAQRRAIPEPLRDCRADRLEMYITNAACKARVTGGRR